MKTYQRSEAGLTVFLALSIVHLLFPVFLIYSWILPDGELALKFKQQQSRKERLEACIKKAEQRQLEAPEPVLPDSFDGSCLGRNKINDAFQHASEPHKPSLYMEESLDTCQPP